MESNYINNIFRIIGKKFTVPIILNIHSKNKMRFNQFLDSITGINSNILSTRLKEMEREKLIKKMIYYETPIKTEYYLTEKGNDLIPILEKMNEYSIKYLPEKL